LFSVLFGFWIMNFTAFNGDAVLELAAQFLALAEKQGGQSSESNPNAHLRCFRISFMWNYSFHAVGAIDFGQSPRRPRAIR